MPAPIRYLSTLPLGAVRLCEHPIAHEEHFPLLSVPRMEGKFGVSTPSSSLSSKAKDMSRARSDGGTSLQPVLEAILLDLCLSKP